MSWSLGAQMWPLAFASISPRGSMALPTGPCSTKVSFRPCATAAHSLPCEGFKVLHSGASGSRLHSCAPTTASSRSSIASANWSRRERSPCVSPAPTHVSARPTLTVGSRLAALAAASFFSFDRGRFLTNQDQDVWLEQIRSGSQHRWDTNFGGWGARLCGLGRVEGRRGGWGSYWDHHSVSSPRSSNRTGGFPAYG